MKTESLGRKKMAMIQNVQGILAILLGPSVIDYLNLDPVSTGIPKTGVNFSGRVKVEDKTQYFEGWFMQEVNPDGSCQIAEDTFWVRLEDHEFQGNYLRQRGLWWLRGEDVTLWGIDASRRWADHYVI